MEFNKKQIWVGLILFGLGFLGILSLLFFDIPLPAIIQEELEKQVGADKIKYITLINPLIMLSIATLLGTLFFRTAQLRIPLIEKWVGLNPQPVESTQIVKNGILGGICAGLAIIAIESIARPFIGTEFIEAAEKFQPPLLVRFLYGGITEEVLMRFGLMSFIVGIIKLLTGKLNSLVYWLGILLAAFIFAIGHLPMVFIIFPEADYLVISYIICGNMAGGIVFGWLYKKQGLESAMIAHMLAHVVMLSMAALLG